MDFTKQRIVHKDESGLIKRIAKPPVRPIYDLPLSPKDIYEMGCQLQKQPITQPLRVRALCYFLYLTGARISEAARFSRIRINVSNDFFFITMNVLKKRRLVGTMRNVPVPRGTRALCMENEMMEVVIQFLNTPEAKSQDTPFWIWGKPSPRNPNGRPDTNGIYLRRFIKLSCYGRVWQAGGYLDKYIDKPLHPHYLRHCRTAHLRSIYKAQDSEIIKFFGWSDGRMLLNYAHITDLTPMFDHKKAS